MTYLYARERFFFLICPLNRVGLVDTLQGPQCATALLCVAYTGTVVYGQKKKTCQCYTTQYACKKTTRREETLAAASPRIEPWARTEECAQTRALAYARKTRLFNAFDLCFEGIRTVQYTRPLFVKRGK